MSGKTLINFNWRLAIYVLMLVSVTLPAASQEFDPLAWNPKSEIALKKLKKDYSFIGDLHKAAQFESDLGFRLGSYLDHVNFLFLLDDTRREMDKKNYKKAFDQMAKFAVELKMPPHYVFAKWIYQGVDSSFRSLTDQCYTQAVKARYHQYRMNRLKEIYVDWIYEDRHSNFGGEFHLGRIKGADIKPVLNRWAAASKEDFEKWYAALSPYD